MHARRAMHLALTAAQTLDATPWPLRVTRACLRHRGARARDPPGSTTKGGRSLAGSSSRTQPLGLDLTLLVLRPTLDPALDALHGSCCMGAVAKVDPLDRPRLGSRTQERGRENGACVPQPITHLSAPASLPAIDAASRSGSEAFDPGLPRAATAAWAVPAAAPRCSSHNLKNVSPFSAGGHEPCPTAHPRSEL